MLELLQNPETWPAVALVLWWCLPAWGRRVLAFLRDLDDYRDERAQRQRRGLPDSSA